MKKLNQSLALATLSLTLIGQQSVSAAIINSTFSGTADFGPLTGESYSGTATFDDSSITGVGTESVSTTQFELNFNGQTFDNGNAEVGGSAEAVFFDGIFTGIQYFSQTEVNLSVALIAGLFDTTDASFTYTSSGIDGSGPVTYNNQNVASTPEPTSVITLIGVGVLGVASKLKKRF